MEQIRVIKEMREHDRTTGRAGKSIRPRFMVWENVPGALSSNKGEDFRAVLEETCRIVSNAAYIPLPKKGKWATVGRIVGAGYSIAYRIIDAQHWGVPQRRRRIFLVADFAGECAAEILFKPNCMPWNPSQGGEAWQGATGVATGCVGATGCLTAGFSAGQSARAGGIGYAEELAPTVRAAASGLNQVPCICAPDLARALTARYDSSPCFDRGQNVVAVYDARGNGAGDIVPTMTGEHNGHISDFTAVIAEKTYCIAGNTIDRKVENGGNGVGVQEDISYTLNTIDHHSVLELTTYQQIVGTLCASDKNGPSNQYVEQNKCVVENLRTLIQRVRRLTPLECERLMGFPDGWTDVPNYETQQLVKRGKQLGEYRTLTRKCTDGVRYKALGNSVVIPCVEYVLGNIADYLRAEGISDITLGSLFDGIGGFPLAGLRHGITPIWASEIEPFPIAVTKHHLTCKNKETDTYQ